MRILNPSQKDFYDRTAFWISVVLALVGIVGMVVALCTLRNLGRQAKAAEDAAKAALLNAQAVINAERPWILVIIEPVDGPMGGFNVSVKNKGRTPPMITAAYISCVAVKDVSALPPKAPSSVGSLIENRIVVPDEAAWISWFNEKTLRSILKGGFPEFSWDGRIFVFGKITYRDLLSQYQASEHETRWIYQYQRANGRQGDPLLSLEGIGAASEYDRYS